jgi:hypothetical protein
VAGRYQEQNVSARGGGVSFWTFQPLDAGAAKIASARISSSISAWTDFFGPASRNKSAVHIVEAPDNLPSEFGVTADHAFGGASFPHGALLDSRAITQGIVDESVLQLAEYELARTWFGWRVRPTPEAQVLMGRGVGFFGLVIAAEARGSGQRRSMVFSLLNRYAAAQAIAPDRRLMEPPFGYSREERISTGFRGALFLVELEDLCGHNNLRDAFREIIQSRTGAETGYEELRSALESASKRDLAEVFRNWLNRPGIPDEFRARYARP